MTLAHPKIKPFDLSDVPAAELKRLKEREQAQRNETKNRGLPVKFVSIEGLLLLQQGLCAKTGKPLVFSDDDEDRADGKPVIAHVLDRTVKRCPGHVVGNVELWRHDANQAEAAEENRARGKARRMAIDLTRERPKPEKRKRSQIKSRGFDKSLRKKFNGQVEKRNA